MSKLEKGLQVVAFYPPLEASIILRSVGYLKESRIHYTVHDKIGETRKSEQKGAHRKRTALEARPFNFGQYRKLTDALKPGEPDDLVPPPLGTGLTCRTAD